MEKTREWKGKEKTWNLRLYPYPGKYEGGYMIDEYVHEVCFIGCDDELGEVEGFGWYGLLRHGHTIFKDHDPELGSLTNDERDFIKSLAGVIVHEDSQGFAYFDYFEDMAELDAAWNTVKAAYDDGCEEVEGDE